MVDDFRRYQAPTTPYPMSLEVSHAQGSFIYDTSGKQYLDLVAGVSAMPLGHGHPNIKQAITQQLDKYAHVMVYGEFIQNPAVQLCRKLAENMPGDLDMTYLVNSGTEAIEAAMKLARRVTGRAEIIAMENCYHGNTLGSLSLMDYEERKAPFRPLLPGISHISFNDIDALQRIGCRTAGVVIESIQGGAGFIVPSREWAKALRKRCDEMGCLLIVDEIQPGLGRTGSWFYVDQLSIVPDVIVTGKGLGGGLPIGALTAKGIHLRMLGQDPVLGHITTFGGNPVIASGALAVLKTIEDEGLMKFVSGKGDRFRESVRHHLIKEIRGVGLMLCLILETAECAEKLVENCLRRGLILFFLLYEPRAVRITPPLNISEEEIDLACGIIMEELNKISCED